MADERTATASPGTERRVRREDLGPERLGHFRPVGVAAVGVGGDHEARRHGQPGSHQLAPGWRPCPRQGKSSGPTAARPTHRDHVRATPRPRPPDVDARRCRPADHVGLRPERSALRAQQDLALVALADLDGGDRVERQRADAGRVHDPVRADGPGLDLAAPAARCRRPTPRRPPPRSPRRTGTPPGRPSRRSPGRGRPRRSAGTTPRPRTRGAGARRARPASGPRSHRARPSTATSTAAAASCHQRRARTAACRSTTAGRGRDGGAGPAGVGVTVAGSSRQRPRLGGGDLREQAGHPGQLADGRRGSARSPPGAARTRPRSSGDREPRTYAASHSR